LEAVKIKPPESFALVTVTLLHSGRRVQHSVSLEHPSRLYALDAVKEALQKSCDEMSAILEGMKNMAAPPRPPIPQPIRK
jgi:hypothetical protein